MSIYMDNKILIILGMVLLILIILNHVTIVTSNPNQTNSQSTQSSQSNKSASCSQTAFGCCPDGVNSKINYYGTNCPPYNPGPGYPTNTPPPPPPSQ
jgi:zona occludens toxin (predicted ATPase)